MVIDGHRELAQAMRGGIAIEEVFFPESSGTQVASLFNESANLHRVRFFAVSDHALAKISFGKRHDVVATAKTPSRSLHDLVLGTVPCVAVLAGIEKPGNVGAVLRSADGAGLDAVVIVDGRTDLFNPNTIRSSLGTIFTQQVVTTSLECFAAWSQERGLKLFLARLDDAMDYTCVDFRQPCAIVLGNEADGLSTKWNGLHHQAIRLPMCGSADSLNVSATAAILFYECRRARGV